MNSTDQFEAIVSQYYELLFRFAISLTREESAAQDLTQQTFYVWATKGHQLRDPSKIKSWLFTTMHRAFLTAQRRQTHFPHEDVQQLAEETLSFAPNVVNELDSTKAAAALAGLDEIYRGAVALFYLEDYSYQEIAAILDVPAGTVKSRISRGLQRLREILLSDNVPATTPDIVERGAVQPTGRSQFLPASAPLRNGTLVPLSTEEHSVST